MSENVNQKATILSLLTLNTDEFQKMLLGGKCWYLAYVYRLIGRTEEQHNACKSKLLTVAESCEPAVLQFIELLMGCDYSFAEMMDTISNDARCSRAMLPPLWEITYSYLSPLSPSEAKKEILRLCG